MSAYPRRAPVCAFDFVNRSLTIFYHTAHKLMHQVRMRTAMAPAMLYGRMIAAPVIRNSPGKLGYLHRQPFGVIGSPNLF